MGHSIQYYKFDENKDKGEILAIANEDAIYESDSRSSLPGNIRFIGGKIYDSEEDAYNAIKKLDKGWYDQLAVKYLHYEQRKETKTIINLRERIKKAEDDLVEYKQKSSIKNRKSKFVGCPRCESKINKEYIMDTGYGWNKCPLCSEELSSETIKKSIENKQINIGKMKEDLIKLIQENNRKGKSKVKWLVKTEFHV